MQHGFFGQRLTPMDWAGTYGSYWAISGSDATSSGNAGGSDALVGDLLPSGDCFFDVLLADGYPSYVYYMGIATAWTPGSAYTNSDTGAVVAYHNGFMYRDSSNLGDLGLGTLNAGRYRIALRYGAGVAYFKRMNNSPTGSISVALPAGYSASTMRPVIVTLAGFPATRSTTLLGSSLGSGGLY